MGPGIYIRKHWWASRGTTDF